MSSPVAYLWNRVRPFLVLFITIETLTRLFFLAYDLANTDYQFGYIALALGAGFIFDLTVFSYFLIPIALFMLIPEKFFARAIMTALYAGMAYTFLFTSISEWFFWEEFATRFNFIAVDYLVYTTEVIDNIMQSYPVFPLLAMIGAASALLGWRYWLRYPGVRQPQPSLKKRVGFVAGSIALASILFFAVPGKMAEIGPNRYVHEIARNGIYELFSAFRHNELDFNQFYMTGDEAKLLPILQDRLGVTAPDQKSPLTRMVKHDGPAKKYNLMLVTVESFSAFFLSEFGSKEGAGLTPNLDALAKESLFFTNLYATGTRTVYGLSAITLSIPPIPGNSIVRRPENENLFSLGGVLNKQGYVSKFIYGGFGYFDDMNHFFEGNGYQIIDRASFTDDEVTFSNAWGVADEDLFRKAIQEADKAHAAGQPFFNMLMTTSNHRPFTYPDGKIDIPSPGKRPGAVKYTDYAIGQLIAESKKHPWFDNTIFVIVADHTASSAGKEQLEPGKYHIPMLVYAPGIIEPGRFDRMMSQIDIAPSLMHLLNISYESRFYGQDVFDPHEQERAFISNYQQLGYISGDSLVVLKPIKNVTYYSQGADGRYMKVNAMPSLLEEALSYYQSATRWKEWSRLE